MPIARLRFPISGSSRPGGRTDLRTFVACVPTNLKAETAWLRRVELERIAYDNFVEYVRPRLYEGVVDHLNDVVQTVVRPTAGGIRPVAPSSCRQTVSGMSSICTRAAARRAPVVS